MAQVITRPSFTDPEYAIRQEVARCNAVMVRYLDAVLTLLQTDVRPTSDILTDEAREVYNALHRAQIAAVGDLERAMRRAGLREGGGAITIGDPNRRSPGAR